MAEDLFEVQVVDDLQHTVGNDPAAEKAEDLPAQAHTDHTEEHAPGQGAQNHGHVFEHGGRTSKRHGFSRTLRRTAGIEEHPQACQHQCPQKPIQYHSRPDGIVVGKGHGKVAPQRGEPLPHAIEDLIGKIPMTVQQLTIDDGQPQGCGEKGQQKPVAKKSGGRGARQLVCCNGKGIDRQEKHQMQRHGSQHLRPAQRLTEAGTEDDAQRQHQVEQIGKQEPKQPRQEIGQKEPGTANGQAVIKVYLLFVVHIAETDGRQKHSHGHGGQGDKHIVPSHDGAQHGIDGLHGLGV